MLVDDCPIATFTEPGASGPAYLIRLAATPGLQGAAGTLLSKMYSWRGYACGPGEPAGGRTVFVAEADGVTIGTMSVCLDRTGWLPADEHFGMQLSALRRQGRRLCEPSRLAIDKGMSKRVFAALIHVSFVYAHRIAGYSDYIIEVNPRHVLFYQQMLGFVTLGQPVTCQRVGAPAVLLRLPLAEMGARIRRSGGSFAGAAPERSFYPWFFSPPEEAQIVARLGGNTALAA